MTSLSEINDFSNSDQTAQEPFLLFSWDPSPSLEMYHQYTVCALAVRCVKHSKMPVCQRKSPKYPRKFWWLPYVCAQEMYKWNKMGSLIAEVFLKENQKSCDRNKLIDSEKVPFEKITPHSLTRIQLPNGEFIQRITYVAEWRNDCSQFQCCKDTANIKWIELKELIGYKSADNQNGNKSGSKSRSKSSSKSRKAKKNIVKSNSDNPNKSQSKKSRKGTRSYIAEILGKLWGSEVITYAILLQKLSTFKFSMEITEQTGKDDAFKYVEQQQPPQPEENNPFKKTEDATKSLFVNFLRQASYGELEVVKLYNDFVQHCYPSIDMSFASFQEYVVRTGLEGKIDTKLFPLRNIFKAMNYKTKNYICFNEFLLGMVAMDPSAPNNKPRIAFLFRFYDHDSDGYLDQDDLKRIHHDLDRVQKSKTNSTKSGSKGKLSNKRINFQTFCQEIEKKNIRGTENLCRASRSIVEYLWSTKTYQMIRFKFMPFGPKMVASCPKCRPSNYILATHSLQLNSEGRCRDPQPLLDNKCQMIMSTISASSANYKSFFHKHSMEFVFNSNSSANYVLEIVRKLAGYNLMSEDQKREVARQVVNGLSLNIIKNICDEVTEIISSEPRVLKVSTPTFVLGDIHGNINDLLIYEAQLWPMAPAVTSSSVLFLGDYVDRGEFSIEVACYLFAMKILAPLKFFLIRGNHEVRGIQKSFTFHKECLEKFGKNGELVFEKFNKVFDILPFAAVVDESIFCVHGGIPYTIRKIEDLLRLPMVLQDPETESPPVWEILWSDPVSNEEFVQLSNFMKKQNEHGYLSNMKRSTAFYFAETATQNFLKLNNLTHVIRAHEVINEGFKFNHKGQVITVFSSSRYCAGNNKAAAISIECSDRKGFVKIISLDT